MPTRPVRACASTEGVGALGDRSIRAGEVASVVQQRVDALLADEAHDLHRLEGGQGQGVQVLIAQDDMRPSGASQRLLFSASLTSPRASASHTLRCRTLDTRRRLGEGLTGARARQRFLLSGSG
jgi:hypothetical protein